MSQISELKSQLDAAIYSRAKELIAYVSADTVAQRVVDILSVVDDLRQVEEIAVCLYPQLAPIFDVATEVEVAIRKLSVAAYETDW